MAIVKIGKRFYNIPNEPVKVEPVKVEIVEPKKPEKPKKAE